MYFKNSQTKDSPPPVEVRVDVVLIQKILDFFGGKINYQREQQSKQLGSSSKENEENEENIEKLSLVSEALKKIAFPNALKTIIESPAEVGDALALLGHDTVPAQSYDTNETRQYIENAKKLFMDSCAKVFPDVDKPSLMHISLDLSLLKTLADSLINERLSGVKDGIKKMSEMVSLGKEDYSVLLSDTEKVIQQLAQVAGVEAWRLELSQEDKEDLAYSAKLLYRLHLLFDFLSKEISEKK